MLTIEEVIIATLKSIPVNITFFNDHFFSYQDLFCIVLDNLQSGCDHFFSGQYTICSG